MWSTRPAFSKVVKGCCQVIEVRIICTSCLVWLRLLHEPIQSVKICLTLRILWTFQLCGAHLHHFHIRAVLVWAEARPELLSDEC